MQDREGLERSQAPFRWTVLGPGPERRYEMEFVSGFVGVRQRSTELTLRPEIGWTVRETAPRVTALATGGGRL